MAAKKRAKKARVATAARSANTKRAAKVSRSRARAKSKPATSTKTTSRAVQAGSKVQGAALAAADRRAREAFLLEVTSLPTAAGREERVIAHIEAWVAERRDRLVLSRDRVGNLTIARHDFLESCAKGIKPLLITAHLDHPAFVVTGLRVVGKGKAAGVELDL